MKRRVLIVTSSYRPAMIADMHRARQLAWELPAAGWDVEILTPDASHQQVSCIDDDSGPFFAAETPIHTVQRSWSGIFAAAGMRSIGWRSFRAMRAKGRELLRSGRFDLVYFSTTQFPLFLLGRDWRRRYGVPYVLDFHDPCYREETTPPLWAERSWKHEVSRRLGRYVEARSVRDAEGLVAVSSSYLETLALRYSTGQLRWEGAGRTATIPFAALPRDLELARPTVLRQRPDSRRETRIAYVGAGGPIMARAFEVLCSSLARLREAGAMSCDRVRIELFGTMLGWREGERRHLAEVAHRLGVADLVMEEPGRVSYRRSLEILEEADGALVLGVDDSGYMPSKLYSYALSGKPLLGVVRADGPAFGEFSRLAPLSGALWFHPDREIPEAEALAALGDFLGAAERRERKDRRALLAPHLAPAMARQHGVLFDACCDNGGAT